eukprot:CAMPEP_0181222884 /NCGR_PEP_ID=MMETSP1096-20121128/30214_1 /TAXON_ID=156174 ORGANISM="Chrysochromulina ericina, Strain CCMP281" /NCGR_SAMPLE_ID=MMETSP1096 /ASSEMBLY_ACC=CAM_ASM_000453 /LENGTH=103 /DNA_ID=CAMNT_0023315695 /DNA_START=35 /DNA_END=346 /DNA_ORIENTATION=+
MHAAQLRAAVCKPAPSKPGPPLHSTALRFTARQSGARVGTAKRTRPRWRWRWELPSRRSGALERCARRFEDTCGGRTRRAGRGAHSATGKGGQVRAFVSSEHR